MNNPSFPHDLTSAERAAVVAESERLEESASGEQRTRTFELNLQGRPPLFIKRGDDDDVFEEASTQLFFYALAKTDASTPRIPKVLEVFNTQEGGYFLVMEKVEAKTLDCCGIPEEKAVQLAAFAVRWLHDQLPSVPDTVFARIFSQASAWHPFFKDHQAPKAFANVNELANFVSQVSRRCRATDNRLSTIDVLNLFGAHRRICHSDVEPRNFLHNAQGVWLVNFQHIAVLPHVFQTYGFFNIGIDFANKVGRALGYQPSTEANKMVPISSVLQASGGGFSAIIAVCNEVGGGHISSRRGQSSEPNVLHELSQRLLIAEI